MKTEIREASHENVRQATDIAAATQSQLGAALRSFSRRPQLTLALLTVACLLPFSGKPVHIDDPIFIWTAQHITHHPLDFYGFSATWWSHATPMWQIQQNPPLAAYYMALIGSVAGWSERALHLGFILPAVVVVLATYRLARHMASNAPLAAMATLAAPGFFVSATSLMCDVSMLALWMLAVIFWIEGLEGEPAQPRYLAISSLLIAACALTKYFGMSLIPLLFAYSLFRRRSLRGWIWYLMVPLLILGGYEFYTHRLYGYGLIWLAAGNPSTSGSGSTRMTVTFVNYLDGTKTLSRRALVGLVFAGGCALPALTFIPLLWRRKQILWGSLVSGLLALFFCRGWSNLGSTHQFEAWLQAHRGWISLQGFFYFAGGIAILVLAVADLWERRGAASVLLVLWVFGTIFFAVVVNWDVNARAMLPMVPAVAILIARRLERMEAASRRWRWPVFAAPLVIAGVISLWVAAGDMAFAETARLAANYIHETMQSKSNSVWFEGRWGFEYYMQLLGAHPLEPEARQCRFGDLVVVPLYNTGQFKVPLNSTPPESVDYDVHTWVTAMNFDAGAGFYFSGWGPLPFVFGPVPKQRYLMTRIVQEK